MAKEYRSGFERLSKSFPDTDSRYAHALEQIRENFDGFETWQGFDPDNLTVANKKQVRRYYNTLREYVEGGPVYKMDFNELPEEITRGGRKNVEKVMQAAQMRTGRKKAKHIFVRFDGDSIPVVKVRNNSPVFVNEKFGYEKEFIPLSSVHLAYDARATITGLAPLVEGARYFRIANGRHEFYAAADLKALANEVERLQQKYAIGKNAWDKWLTGVMAYYTDATPGEAIRYISKSKKKYADKIKRESAKLRKKRK